MWCLFFFSVSVFIASTQTFNVYYGPPREATLDERPFHVAIVKNHEYKCSGALISEKCVLTACSCIIDEKIDVAKTSKLPDNYTLVTYTTHILSDQSYWEHASDVFIADGCNTRTNENDAAVLCSRKPLMGYEEALVRVKTNENVRGIVSGWGLSVEGQNMVQAELHRAYMRIISLEECRRLYFRVRNVPDSAICAVATKEVRGFCEGDFGAPLTHGEGLIGIAVSRFGCGKKKYPGIFTNVSMLSKYIDSVVKEFETQGESYYKSRNDLSVNV